MNTSNLKPTIDALGRLKAQLAELEAQEAVLKDALKELGPGAYEGDLFRITISDTDRDQLDMKAVREKLSPQFIRAHTTTKPVRTLRVTARATGNTGK